MWNVFVPFAALLPWIAWATGEVAADAPGKTLFDNVARILLEDYYDESFRTTELPALVETYRAKACAAKSPDEQRHVVQAFLSNIPASHLALISEESFAAIHGDLEGTKDPTFGFEVIEHDGKQYAFNVLEKGPADRAGLKRGDRIVTIDGMLANESPRLGWRTDDAFLPDPPVRPVLGNEGDVMKLRIERRPGEYHEIEIPNAPYSAWEAAKASVRVIERDDKRIGLIHFWLIHMTGPDELLRESLEGELADCDVLVLDLRGRGGNGAMVPRILDVLSGTTSDWKKPVVGLINRHSRSAKEVIAHEFRKQALGTLVGERTAGAVIPATIRDVGFGMRLMFPSFTLPEHTEFLEFKGVKPDIVVSEVGPYSAGADPILETGLVEAVRLANENPERFADRRRAADKKYPRRSRSALRRLHRGPKALLERPERPDAGFDARAMDALSKMVDALGGEEALRRHRFRTIRGKRLIAGMMSATYEQLQAVPDKSVSRMKMAGREAIVQGYDGTTGWMINHIEGDRLLTDEELTRDAWERDFYYDLNIRDHHQAIAYLGEKDYADRKCHEIRLTGRTGDVRLMYLDSGSYLPIGWVGQVETNAGPMDMARVVTEFKTFDGEVVAVKYTDDLAGMQDMVSTVTEVSFEPIPDSVFAVPETLRPKGAN